MTQYSLESRTYVVRFAPLFADGSWPVAFRVIANSTREAEERVIAHIKARRSEYTLPEGNMPTTVISVVEDDLKTIP